MCIVKDALTDIIGTQTMDVFFAVNIVLLLTIAIH